MANLENDSVQNEHIRKDSTKKLYSAMESDDKPESAVAQFNHKPFEPIKRVSYKMCNGCGKMIPAGRDKCYTCRLRYVRGGRNG